jgi:hypothetical protein
VDDGVLAEANPACVALVPVTTSAQWSPAPGRLPRPNPVFVAHLIATAAQVPQTRPLCRATAADAQSAYRAPTPGSVCRHPDAANHLITRAFIGAYPDRKTKARWDLIESPSRFRFD